MKRKVADFLYEDLLVNFGARRLDIKKIKIPPIIQLALAVLILVVITLIIGVQSTALTGFPKGYDFFGHASLVKIIRDNFPHVFWNPYWYAGEILFPRAYPPLYHFLLAGLSGMGEIWKMGDIGELMKGVAALNIIVTALAIFGIIYFLAKRVLPAIIGALFYLSSSTGWSYLLIDGLYPRVFAQMT